MFVMLGKSWLHHSFLKPNFMIKSEKQIRKIISDGFQKVQVDTSKSDVTAERNLMTDLLGPNGNGDTESLSDWRRHHGHWHRPQRGGRRH